MDRTFDGQLAQLKNSMIEMSNCVEQALLKCSEGIKNRSISTLEEVHTIEEKINEYQVNVDSLCTNVLAKLGPVAKDLRLTISIIKMNADLERMGDQCANIAYLGKDILKRNPEENKAVNFDEINQMIEAVIKMVKVSLDCFINLDSNIAKEVLKMDDEVDQFKSHIKAANIQKIKENPQFSESYLDLIFISRNLERMGDHATNIAEDVIYALSGKDIRHGSN